MRRANSRVVMMESVVHLLLREIPSIYSNKKGCSSCKITIHHCPGVTGYSERSTLSIKSNQALSNTILSGISLFSGSIPLSRYHLKRGSRGQDVAPYLEGIFTGITCTDRAHLNGSFCRLWMMNWFLREGISICVFLPEFVLDY